MRVNSDTRQTGGGTCRKWMNACFVPVAKAEVEVEVEVEATDSSP
jgi:hypothetical protein